MTIKQIHKKPSSGHTVGGRRPAQTRKKPKDLSACEERGRREGGGVHAVGMR